MLGVWAPWMDGGVGEGEEWVWWWGVSSPTTTCTLQVVQPLLEVVQPLLEVVSPQALGSCSTKAT